MHTTSASHLHRLLAGTAARATKAPPDAETPRAPGAATGAAAGAKRHHADAMGSAQGRGASGFGLSWVEAGEVEKSGWNLDSVFPVASWSCGARSATGSSPRPSSGDKSRTASS